MHPPKRRVRIWVGVGIVLLLVLAVLPFQDARKKVALVAESDLGDGRIFQIEAVTFGTNHQVGFESAIVKRFGGLLPRKVRQFLEPSIPRSSIQRNEPVLVVWVNAIDATFRTNVDCQRVRLDLVDADGTAYGELQSSWYGYEKFWRVGHIFQAFPRHSRTLNLKVTTWKGTNSTQFALDNPGYTEPAAWTGAKVPQKQMRGEYEIALTSLVATNNKGAYWKTPASYWVPQFEIRRAGEKQGSGWDIEWNAEDPYGNRGQELGLRQPVLKFTVDCYPSGTNMGAAVLITNLAAADVRTTTNIIWNVPAMVSSNRVVILGFFPAGMYIFSEGEYLTNPPVQLGPTRGGAPSGWVGTSRQTPLRNISYHGHYSDAPVIYVRVANPKSKERIAIRLRDVDSGKYFLTMAEPQGAAANVLPFIVRTPQNVTNVMAELVRLPALNAEFLVETAGNERTDDVR